MQKLKIMTEQELNQIFGTLDSLIPPHEGRWEHLMEGVHQRSPGATCWKVSDMQQPLGGLQCSHAALGPDLFKLFHHFKTVRLSSDLLSRLRDARKPDGSTENVGPILTDWVSVSLNIIQHIEHNYSFIVSDTV